ncbi:hypothetical protein WJX77_011579 [Trebouxia sp. C0004]
MSAPSLYFSILEVVYLMYQAYYWLPVILLSLTAAAAVSLMVTLRRQQLKRGKAMCDMVLLQGACMVVESTLSGEAAQVRKAAFVPEDGVRCGIRRMQRMRFWPWFVAQGSTPRWAACSGVHQCCAFPYVCNSWQGSVQGIQGTIEEMNRMRFYRAELAFVNSLPLIDSAFKKAEQDSNVPSTSKAAIGHANVKSTQSTLDQSFAKAPKARRSQILLAPLMLLMGMVMQILGQYAVRIKSLTEIKVPLTRMHSRLVKLQGTGIKKGWVDDPAVSGPTLREVWGSLDTLNDDLFHWLQKLLELILAGHSAERAFAKDIANCS